MGKSALRQRSEAGVEVRNTWVALDHATSRSRCYGSVLFATAEGAAAALRTPHWLDQPPDPRHLDRLEGLRDSRSYI